MRVHHRLSSPDVIPPRNDAWPARLAPSTDESWSVHEGPSTRFSLCCPFRTARKPALRNPTPGREERTRPESRGSSAASDMLPPAREHPFAAEAEWECKEPAPADLVALERRGIAAGWRGLLDEGEQSQALSKGGFFRRGPAVRAAFERFMLRQWNHEVSFLNAVKSLRDLYLRDPASSEVKPAIQRIYNQFIDPSSHTAVTVAGDKLRQVEAQVRAADSPAVFDALVEDIARNLEHGPWLQFLESPAV